MFSNGGSIRSWSNLHGKIWRLYWRRDFKPQWKFGLNHEQGKCWHRRMPRPWEHYWGLTTAEKIWKSKPEHYRVMKSITSRIDLLSKKKKNQSFKYGFLQGLYTGKDNLAVKSNGCKPAVIRILNLKKHSRMFGASTVSGSSVNEHSQ